MKKIIKLGIILLIISFVAAAALAFTNDLTAPAIDMQRKQASELARKEVLPTADRFEPVTEDQLKEIVALQSEILDAYIGYKGSDVIGYVVKSNPKGYGGPVEVVAGISVEGTIAGVRMGNNQETPGLGTVAKQPSYYEQYNGMKTDQEIGVNKTTSTDYEVQAISGATITSSCVTKGVNIAVEASAILSGK
jgi:electron transport complex protein RnfG